MLMEVEVHIGRGGIYDMDSYDSVDVDVSKLSDPKYRTYIATEIMKTIDEAVNYGTNAGWKL